MGNVLFSRSRGGDRFKSWSEITFSFFSLFPLLTETDGVFTLPTFYCHSPPSPLPHLACPLSDKPEEPLISAPTNPCSSSFSLNNVQNSTCPLQSHWCGKHTYQYVYTVFLCTHIIGHLKIINRRVSLTETWHEKFLF